MLNISNLATKWGHIFAGINEFNTFRGTTIDTRADLIASTYTTAAEQRLATSGLYTQMVSADSILQDTVDYFFTLSKTTLLVASLQDSQFPIATDDTTLFVKLINDMIAQADTFQEPTIQIGGADIIAATSITTLEGSPYGNGVIVGTIIEPRTGVQKYFSYAETISLVCSIDSYNGGATSGQESFAVNSFAAVNTDDSGWPKGSGTGTTLQSSPSSSSNLYSNAYFDSWDDTDPNLVNDWVTVGLTPGTTIFQSTDAYVGSYSCKLTAAPLNSELYQDLSGLTGSTNYLAAIRIKRVTAITGGVVTYALRDDLGNILNDAAGNPMSFDYALTGVAGDFVLTWQVFSVPRGYPDPTRLSIKVTTAMNAAETIELATTELIQMDTLYTGGPDVAFLPGNVGWAQNDSYELVVTSTADTTTFVGNLLRLYPTIAPSYDIPVAAIPTISDALIV